MREKYILILFILISILFSGCEKIQPGPEDRAEFTATDGVILVGKFVPPMMGGTPKTLDKLTFIMMHGLASTKGEWFSFADKLAKEGYGYFAFDLRGHGESTKNKNGGTIDYKYFGQPGPGSKWELMITDVDSAVKYITSKKGIPKNRIALMGASVGANVALIYSAKHKFIPLVVLLSPGWEYIGLNIESSIKEYGHKPLLIAASPGDEYAYKSSIIMEQIANKYGTTVKFLSGKEKQHGVQMFTPAFEDLLISWLKNTDTH